MNGNQIWGEKKNKHTKSFRAGLFLSEVMLLETCFHLKRKLIICDLLSSLRRDGR